MNGKVTSVPCFVPCFYNSTSSGSIKDGNFKYSSGTKEIWRGEKIEPAKPWDREIGGWAWKWGGRKINSVAEKDEIEKDDRGMYKKMRDEAWDKGKYIKYITLVGNSLDAWVNGTGEYHRKGNQAPVPFKVLATLNPLMGAADGIKVISQGEDIYGCKADSWIDYSTAVLGIAGGGVLGAEVRAGKEIVKPVVKNSATVIGVLDDATVFDEAK